MATEAEKTTLLMNKFAQTPFTNYTAGLLGQGKGSAAPMITSLNIFNQPIPVPPPFIVTTPTSLATATSTNVISSSGAIVSTTNVGTKYTLSSCPYIVYYNKLTLSDNSLRTGYSFFYAGVNLSDVVGTNLLRNAIPFNYDPL